jgi:hypothetical protein
MRKRLKLFIFGLPTGQIRALFGTPAADFRLTVCPGRNEENGPVFSRTLKPALAV